MSDFHLSTNGRWRLRFDEEERPTEDDDASSGASDLRAFQREEMVACERCGRASPPTRMKCLYCGAQLPVAERGEDLRRPALKPLEEWERGFNIVLAPRTDAVVAQMSDGALGAASSLVRIKPEQLNEMIATGVRLPLARTGDHAEVALLVQRLCALGLAVEVVADDDLATEQLPPRRVRKIEFDDEAITGWTTASGESQRAAWGEIALIVSGHIFKKRIEVEELSRRGASAEVVESRELSEDESVLDIYFTDDAANWRLNASGFDYSCLGARKSLLASENFARLVELFGERASRAAFDDSYKRIRHLLRFAWSPTERTEAGGLRRARPGRFSTEAITLVTNEAQLTRYSRLLRHFAAQTQTTK